MVKVVSAGQNTKCTIDFHGHRSPCLTWCAEALLDLIDLIKLSGTAQGGIHLGCFVESGIVDLVGLEVLVIQHHWIETMAPEDLSVDVARPGLGALSRRFHCTLKDHNDFKLILQHIGGIEVVEWRVLINLVLNNHRPDKEQVGSRVIGAYLQFREVLRHHLALLGALRPDQLSPHPGPDDVGLPHVTHPEHQGQASIPLANDCVLGEQQRLGPLLSPRHLGKHNSGHKGRRHYTVNGLEAHHENGFGALGRRCADTIADGVLSLNGEQETGGETIDGRNTRCPARLL